MTIDSMTPDGSRRLVVFAPGLREPGGAARRSALLVMKLAERGWKVRVVTRAGTESRLRFRREKEVSICEVPGFGRPRLGALLFITLSVPLGLVWGKGARAMLSIQLTSQTTAGAICCTLLRKPLIAFLTTGGSVSEISYIRSSLTFGLRRRVLSTASVLVAQTDHAANELSQLVPSARVEVIPNPVEAIHASALNGHPTVLFAGRFSEEKDLDGLLDAWREIACDDEMARLVLVGAGGHYRSVEGELRRKIASDEILTKSVDLPGWVDDVRQYLSRSDVFAFPSRSEGMSNSLLEACAAARVVVASDIPSNIAVLGAEYPLLFKTSDTEDFERALRAGLYDRDVRSAALDHIRQRMPTFHSDAFIDRVENVIAGCASPSTP